MLEYKLDMLNKFQYYFIHDRLFRFLTFFVVTSFVSITALMIWNPGDRQLERRRNAMERCVDFLVAPPDSLKNSSQKEVQYEVRFEDEFFCPTKPYTVLEALQRAEFVLNTRGKLLNVVFSVTPQGTIVTSMLGQQNSPEGRWLPAVGGSEITDKPLDKIIIEGPSYLRFYYK